MCVFESKDNFYFDIGYGEIPPHYVPRGAPRFFWACRCASCEPHEDISQRTHGGPYKTAKAAERASERAITKALGVIRLQFHDGGKLPSYEQH